MFFPTSALRATQPQRKKVYGLVWPRFGPGRYGVYKRWGNTPDQRREMLEYDRIDGFNQCTGEGSFVAEAWILGLSVFALSVLLVMAVRRIKIRRRKRLESTQRNELETVQGLTATDAP